MEKFTQDELTIVVMATVMYVGREAMRCSTKRLCWHQCGKVMYLHRAPEGISAFELCALGL